MRTVNIEVALYNEDYEEGFSECCEAADDAKNQFLPWLNISLEDLGLKALTEEQCRGMAIYPVGEAKFIEADSTRRHGSCYFDVEVQVPDHIWIAMDAAEVAQSVREHTGD